MLLAIDVGNTNISFGVYTGKRLLSHWRMRTDIEKSSDELGLFIVSAFNYNKLSLTDVRDVIICSVVPPIVHSLVNAVIKYLHCEPMIVGPGIKTGINIKYENPREVGSDRIVNAVAAVKLYDAPAIIVDFGTATTFCAVNSNHDYLGGVICPGIKVSVDALFSKTAKLPRIEILKPKQTIGRTTISSMQSGLFYGYVGQVDYIVRRMKREMNESDIKVIATGGLAKLIASETEIVDNIDRMLTMEGLRIIYEMNS